ncbi:MAG: Phycobilisome degradation protein nblA [Phormidesmis priestleyi Ana]|uniref:Phycobilisome degradation protein nblA n=1 Tax=Phormidesmis priestleyi Ana TaxID=1666911 RepID=A0A0P7YTB2_9CYAN|nr:MAG: Phycobilisome degradation protein nblA [Phormidesmis priestleyi Ana]
MLYCDELSLEQQYTLRVLSEQVKALSREEAHQSLIDLYRQMMIKENYRRQIKR